MVSLSAGGLAAGVGTGSATITATSGSVTGATNLVVNSAFTPTGSLATARFVPTATLLDNGMVLITGGLGYPSGLRINSTYYIASYELYDAATGVFTPSGSLATARWLHTATLLISGTTKNLTKVLITGGSDCNFGPPFLSMFPLSAPSCTRRPQVRSPRPVA